MGWFENLRALKSESTMSMREISTKSGIPEPTLEKIFSGATKNPGVNTIQSLVHALGYTLNDIDPDAKIGSKDGLTPDEKNHIKKYRSLDDYGKEAVAGLLDVEYRRCQEEKSHTPKLDIRAEVASYQAELELQEEAAEKLSVSDGSGGTEKMA